MNYSTTNTYTMKREFLTFSNKLSKDLTRPKKKFVADMTYGMLASNSCLLSDIADTLHEDIKKKNTIERLSLNLANGTPNLLLSNYLDYIKNWVPDEPVIHIDDSDVVKPEGYKFESLGMVRDGLESSSSKNVYKKGYHVTEACVMTSNGHPVSIFSMFLKLDKLKQDYVIRLTKKRKLFLHNKWVSATELCNRRKGKIKAKFFLQRKRSCSLSISCKSTSYHFT